MAAVRDHAQGSDEGRLLEVASDNYSQLLEANPQPSAPEQMDLLLAHIAEQSGPERTPVFLNTATDYAVFSASGPQGLTFLLDSLVQKGLVEMHTKRRPDNVMSPDFQLTMAGHERLEAKRRQPRGATGWETVDRSLKDAEERLAQAKTVEQFQSVGHGCRQTLVYLAQAVYDPARHPPPDGKKPSPTDASRMLEGYVTTELAGGSNEEARRLVKAAESFTDAVTHKQTADFRSAAVCMEATRSLVEMVAIISGRRDRQDG